MQIKRLTRLNIVLAVAVAIVAGYVVLVSIPNAIAHSDTYAGDCKINEQGFCED